MLRRNGDPPGAAINGGMLTSISSSSRAEILGQMCTKHVHCFNRKGERKEKKKKERKKDFTGNYNQFELRDSFMSVRRVTVHTFDLLSFYSL